MAAKRVLYFGQSRGGGLAKRRGQEAEVVFSIQVSKFQNFKILALQQSSKKEM